MAGSWLNGHWARQGRVFGVSGEHGWMNSHAQVPTPLRLPDRLRVYFATRPEPGFSLPAYVDLDINEPSRILRLCERPLLDPGPPGSFDEHGIMPSAVVREGSVVYLYYSGWSRCASVPYTNSTGLAVSRDGGDTFERAVPGPVLSRGPHDPYSATSPFVLRRGDGWRMWYCSGTAWPLIDGKYEHVYDIKAATSVDGVHWTCLREPAVAQSHPLEAITRPTVYVDERRHHMWYCVRGSRDFRDGEQAYRIGYAHSSDGRSWIRDDSSAGIAPSTDAWDSAMQAYPYVVELPQGLALFYNGNGFGQTGFGYALWQRC